MILILMQSRSGSSLVASIFNAHGYDTKHNETRNDFGYIDWEHLPAKKWLYARKSEMQYANGQFCEGFAGVEQVIEPNDCVKIGVEYWPMFRHMKDCKVFTVRREPIQIAKSLAEKRNARNRQRQPSRAMWRMVKVREQLLDQARDEANGVDIQVQPLIDGGFEQLRQAFEHHGLSLNERAARQCVEPKQWHQR